MLRSRAPPAAGVTPVLEVGPSMLALLAALAHAHGPAPAGLDVLAWSDDAACDARAPAPALVRTNIGLGAWNGRSYTYACPSRWGGEEQALAAADPTGTRLVLAGTVTVAWSDDAGCTARVLEVPGTPLGVGWWESRGWVLTRDFLDGASYVAWVEDGVADVNRLDGITPDGLLATDDGVWAAGATPAPYALRFDPTFARQTAYVAAPPEADRLVPRAVRDGGVWLVATGDDGLRSLWRADPDDAVLAVGPALALHGPVWHDDVGLAVADGVLWRDDGDGFVEVGPVDWTCLRDVDGVIVACSLEATRVLLDLDPLTLAPVFAIGQLDAPDPACDAVDGGCERDWVHFGGESGLALTWAGDCPLDPRLDAPPAATCGCAVGRPPSLGGLVLLGLLARRRRR